MDQFHVSNKRLSTREADSMVKRDLAFMGDSSIDESEQNGEIKDHSLLAMDESDDEDIMILMDKSDSNNEKEKSKVCFLDIKVNINSYSQKKKFLSQLSLMMNTTLYPLKKNNL